MKFLIKLFLGLVILVAVLLVAARFAGPPIATRVVNSTLKEKFGESSSFEGIDLALLQGRVGLGALRIAQPEGFGDGFFASYDSIEADVDLRSLTSDTIIVETLRVVNPSFNYRVNPEGFSNVEAAIAAFAPAEPETEPETEPEDESSSPPKKLIVRNLEILGVNFTANSENSPRPVTVKLEDFNLEIRDFTFDPADPDFGPRVLETAIVLSIGAFHASQPDGFSGDTLVGLDGLDLSISVSEARPETFAIESIIVNSPFASVQVNETGGNNIEALIEALIPAAFVTTSQDDPAAEEDTVTPEPTPTAPPAKMMALALDSLRIESAGFELLSADPANPATIKMADLAVLLAGIELDPATNAIQIAEVDLSNAAFDIVRLKPADTETATATNEAEPTTAPVETDSTVATAEDSTESSTPTGRIALNRFNLNGFTVDLRDEALMSEPLVYTLDPITTSAQGIVIDPSSGNLEPATIELSFTLVQGGELQNAEFVSLTRITDLHQKIPSLATALRFTGFDLAPLRPLLPPGVITALGGSGLDVQVDAQVSETLLDGSFAIINNKGNRTAIPIKGTPTKPEISFQSIFTAVLGRPLDMAGNVASGAVGAAAEIGSGAADAAKNIGKGAGETAKKIGGGLMSSVKGLASGDLDAVTGGVKDATVGAAGEAGKAAQETAGKATQTVGSAAGAAAGSATVIAWREDTPVRHAASVEAATEWLESITFPFDSSTPAPTVEEEPELDPSAE